MKRAWIILLAIAMCPGCITLSDGRSVSVDAGGAKKIIDTLLGRKPPPKNDLELMLRAYEEGNLTAYYEETRVTRLGFGQPPESADLSVGVKADRDQWKPSVLQPSPRANIGGVERDIPPPPGLDNKAEIRSWTNSGLTYGAWLETPDGQRWLNR